MEGLRYKIRSITSEIERLKKIKVGASKEISDILISMGSTPLSTGASLEELIRRPELSYEKIKELDADRPELPEDIREQINIEIKYRGYIEREQRQVEAFKKMENKRLPMDIDYEKISGIRIEARQKLNDFKPESVGQASRIQGVSPADISVLLVYLEGRRG